MASLRRNKTLSPDGQTARFLYTIIKQLDLKSIDWNLVAGSLEITNGHAARMRYSRFKQHMEGQITQSRAPKAGKKEKEGKEGKGGLKKGKKRCYEEEEQGEADVKKGAASCVKSETRPAGAAVEVKREGGDNRIKEEPDTCTASSCAVQIKSEPCLLPEVRPAVVSQAPPAITIKREQPEPETNDGTTTTNPDIWRILPQSSANHGISREDQAAPRSTAVPTLAPASRTPLFPPGQQLLSFAPAAQQPTTVSMADLEIAPRPPRPSATTTGAGASHRPQGRRSIDGAGTSRHRVPPPGAAAAAADTVRIKAEPSAAPTVMKTEPIDDPFTIL